MVKQTAKDLRLILVQSAFTAFALLIVIKLFYIQVIKNKDYQAMASNQHWDSRVLASKRGDIQASDGFPLATTKNFYIVFAEPKKITDIDNYTLALAPIFAQDPFDSKEVQNKRDELKEKLANKDLYWTLIEKNISEKQKTKIAELKLVGIGFEDDPKRYYPEGTLASHILGYVAGSETGENKGYFGIEGYFDGDLIGKPGRILEEKGANGGAILFGGYRKIPPINGRSTILTLDRGVQFFVEKMLKDGVEKYKAQSGTVVIIDPATGNIISIANYPTFNPADLNPSIKNSETSLNGEDKNNSDITKKSELKIQKKDIAITDTYEPGSIMKPLTVSTAIELGLIGPDTTFNDDGPKVYSDYTIDNWNGKHLGVQTITQLLEKSNNIGAAWVGTQVGSKKLDEYFRRFGLGELTGITLEGENTGTLRDVTDWKDIDLATAAFGQGVSASPLQMAMAFSVFANDGILMKPRIVAKIVNDTKEVNFPPEQRRRVLSNKTIKTIVPLLVNAVEFGESRYFNIKGYTIAGKTGTAQIPFEGKYDPTKTNATFVGFLPNAPDGKKFIMLVKLEEPKTSIYAAETAVPLWMELLRQLTIYYGIPPDRTI